MKILVPVDGSSFTKRMLAYVAAHDEWLGPHHRYTLLTVTAPLPGLAASALDKATVQGFHAEQAEKVFKPLRTFFARQKLDAEFVAKVGTPAEVIAATATKGKYDLVMMGSHGHGLLGRLVLGSVTTRVLSQTDVPVLIVR